MKKMTFECCCTILLTMSLILASGCNTQQDECPIADRNDGDRDIELENDYVIDGDEERELENERDTQEAWDADSGEEDVAPACTGDAPLNSRQDGVCEGSKKTCANGTWQEEYTQLPRFQSEESWCDYFDNDCDGITDEGCHGSPCTLASDCTSSHCQNGFCCSEGDCCRTSGDCPESYSSAPICKIPETCQGSRHDAACVHHECKSLAIQDDSACDQNTIADTCYYFLDVYCSGDRQQFEVPKCRKSCYGDGVCDSSALCRDFNCVCPPNLIGPDCSECNIGYASESCTECAQHFMLDVSNDVCHMSCSHPSACGEGRYLCSDQSGRAVCDCSYSPFQLVAQVGNVPLYTVVNDDRLYLVTAMGDLAIYDIEDPSNASRLTLYPMGHPIEHIAVSGTTVYFSSFEGHPGALDVSNPSSPQLFAELTDVSGVQDLRAEGSTLYIIGQYGGSNQPIGFHVFDVPREETVSHIGTYVSTDYDFAAFSLNGNYAYLAAYESGMIILNVSDPSNPTVAGAYPSEGREFREITVENDVAYVLDDEDDLHLIDVSVVDNCTGLHIYAPQGDTPEQYVQIHSLAVMDGIIFLAMGARGAASITIMDARNPASPTISEPGQAVNWAYHLSAANGRLYVSRISDVLIFAADTTLRFPYFDRLITGGNTRTVAVDGDYAYLGVNIWMRDKGLMIYDISTPEAPVFLRSVLQEYDILDIAIKGDMAYLAAGTDGLIALDISDRASPVVTDTFFPGNFISVSSLEVEGNSAFLLVGIDGFQIVDITDPNRLIQISSRDTVNPLLRTEYLSLNVNDGYLYVQEKGYGIRIFDVRDRTRPALVGGFKTQGTGSDIEISQGRLYMASGNNLMIADVSAPQRPEIVTMYSVPGHLNDIIMRDEWIFLFSDSNISVSNQVDLRELAEPITVWDSYDFYLEDNNILRGEYLFSANSDGGLMVFDADFMSCNCQEGYSGKTCNRCAEGYSGYPDCIADEAGR